LSDDVWSGWSRFNEPDTYIDTIGPSYSRAEGPGRASVGVDTRALHRNRMDALHGGFIAAFADHAGFAALRALGRPEQMNAVTIDLQLQFFGAGRVGPPLIAEVEFLKETGRLFFLRMLFRQEDATIASATATFRKASEKAA
jgi:uncharacterized protein (TIGR00369 family)